MITNLTGLRFYMAFWVMIYHIKDAIDIPILSQIIDKGYLGVDVFFFLSGYILTHVYQISDNEKFSRVDYLRFIQKRIARIYPLHIVTLLGAILLSILLNRFVNPYPLYLNHVPYQAFMIHSWGFLENARLNYPSWSVSAEWFAYLTLFPLSLILISKTFLIRVLTITVSFLLLMTITYYNFQNDFGNVLGFGIIRILPEFLMGCFTYDLYKRKQLKNLKYNLATFVGIGFVGWLVFDNLDFFLISFFPIVILWLHTTNDNISQFFFGKRIPLFLGEISYSLYMTHFFAWKFNGILHHNIFGSEYNSFIYVLNYIVITVILSVGAYFLVEIPSRKYINNLHLFN